MADGSTIEWLAFPGTKPASWNPVVGCTRVNEGCRNCYAERMARRLAGNPATPQYGGTIDEQGRWSGVVNLVERALELPLRWRSPRTVFVDSMGDLFHPAVPFYWESDRPEDEPGYFGYLDRLFGICALTPQHLFIVLTKRGERQCAYWSHPDTRHRVHAAMQDWRNMTVDGERPCKLACMERDQNRRWLVPKDLAHEAPAFPEGLPWPLPNVILGVSVVDQPSADDQIPWLLKTPAAARVVSYEPALGPVDLSDFAQCEDCGQLVRDYGPNTPDICPASGVDRMPRELLGLCGYCHSPWREPETGEFCLNIDWVICGGESGPKARPMHPHWARSARDQCQAAGVPFFFKQWGEWEVASYKNGHFGSVMPETGEKYTWLGIDGRTQNPSAHGLEEAYAMARVGKKRAGAVLDGREWRELPGMVGTTD